MVGENDRVRWATMELALPPPRAASTEGCKKKSSRVYDVPRAVEAMLIFSVSGWPTRVLRSFRSPCRLVVGHIYAAS